MLDLLLVTLISTLIAQADQYTPTPSPSPTPGTHTLTLALPDRWVRTESGRYNEWRSPDGGSDFRVSVMPVTPAMRGPNAADAVKAMFAKTVAMFNSSAKIDVKSVHVCNGQQTAYRVDDPLGTASAGFMMVVPGTDSAGLINYEVMPGRKADRAIETTVDKLCWP